jgi:peptide deformylase
MVLPILKYGDPLLQKLCEPVTVYDADLEQLARNMVETMYSAPGVGLAAPQVGVLKRLIALDVTVGQKEGNLIVVVNPEIIAAEGEQFEDEGCLSIPDFTAKVHRPYRLVVSGKDIRGKETIIEGEGLLSRVLCHEIDHLNGILFIDHLSPIKRDIIKRKIRKKVRAGEW